MAVYDKHIQPTDTLGFVVYSQPLSKFQEDLGKVDSPIKRNNIYFIGQERKLYLDGVYYGISAEELQQLSNDIGTLASIIATPIEVKKIEGPQGTQSSYEYTTIGPALKYLDQQLNSLKGAGSGSVADQISTAINALNASFSRNYIDAEYYTAEDANAWNNAHQGEDGFIAKQAGDIKTAASVQSGHVGIKVVETNGKITTVDLVEYDIASAAALEGVQGQLVSGIQGVQGQITSGIQGVQSQLDLLTSGDLSTIQNAITAIKNELGGEEGEEGPQGAQTRNLVGSLLDAVATLLPAKNQETNNYTLYIGGEEGVQVTKLQDAIDTLNTLIEEANSGSSEGIQGVQTAIENLGATVKDNYTNEVYYTQQEIDDATAAYTADDVASMSQEGQAAWFVSHPAYGKTTSTIKTSAGVQSGHVGIKVTEEGGKLTSVDIVESDIASAATVNKLVNQLTWQVM